MAQTDWLRNKVKIHIRDMSATESEIDGIIDTVLTEIALETRLFKKLYGFTVSKDEPQYNFRYLTKMNEQVEEEPGNIVLGDISPEDLVNFIDTGVFPTITVDKNLEIETHQSQFLDLLDIFDLEGMSVLDKFEERGSTYYFVYDQEWLNCNDGKNFMFAAWVKPEVMELHDEDLSIILSTVIAGCKFYLYDTLHSKDDVQATNYDFMRWHQAKENLGNRFPTTVFSTKETNKWL